MTTVSAPPSPALFFETVNAYQRTAALKAGVDLGVFTVIGRGVESPSEIAVECGAPERGIRVLCDFLVICGLIVKANGAYRLTPDSAMFLNASSPAYLGGTLDLLLGRDISGPIQNLSAVVRHGGPLEPEESTTAPEHPVWVTFARAMMPFMMPTAAQIADLIPFAAEQPVKVLDIAAGHGIFGLSFARKYPQAQITALDWPQVLEVAQENAARFGVADRYSTLPGNAFDVPLGDGYDVVLLTNFLHHFDPQTNEGLLNRVHAALKPGGKAVTLEFIPNEDRVTPPRDAGFALIMLATTQAGDAYTYGQLESMFRAAGFASSTMHEMPGSGSRVVVSVA